jgi:hypothetical protein
MMEGLSIAEHLRAYSAQRAFEIARTRYVRTRSGERSAAHLQPLQRERHARTAAIARLQAVLEFHTARADRARREFEREFPGRFRGLHVQRPTVFERIVTRGESERLYRELRFWTVCRDKVAMELRIQRQRLAYLTREMVALEETHKDTVERRLTTVAGMREALASDSQLALAHIRLTEIVDKSSLRP